MKTFFKSVFATMVGCLFSFILLFVIFLIFLFGAVSLSKKEVKVTIKPKAILHITLDHPLLERGTKNPLEEIDFYRFKPTWALGLNEIISAIDAAAEEENISAIFIEPPLFIEQDFAYLEEIRNALLKFKKTGKPIIAYADEFSQKSYYLASVADEIYLNPNGFFDFRGLALNLLFLKGTLSKLDIDAQVLRYGKYKNAAELFEYDKMSDENREQFTAMISSMWKYYLQNISSVRGIGTEKLNNISDSLLIRSAADALAFAFVDKLIYRDEVLEILKKHINFDGKINFLPSVTLPKYAKSILSKPQKPLKNKIAVIYATGEIHTGKGDGETIGSDVLSREIRRARLDDNIKAVVLRVNSPGGSAVASEAIWREVELTSNVKPVVVSMGDVAASGGYYISCAANKIIAQPNTITGSIGVIGVIFNMENFFKNKLGVTFDVVKTNEHADMFTMTRPLTTFEIKVIQQYIDNIYNTFLQRVADGRGMDIKEVDKIAQGRLWSGKEAKDIGLIDETGGLNDAIRISAELANIEDYSIIELPRQKDMFEELFMHVFDGELMKYFSERLFKLHPYLHSLNFIRHTDPFLTRMEYDIIIE